MYTRILVPLDGSKLAEAVLPHAQTLAKATGAELILLNVVPTVTAEFSIPARTPASSAAQIEEAEMKVYLKEMCSALEKEGLRAAYLIRQGAVPETILKVAEVMQADLISMSTHGRTGAERLLLGSVTDEVVHHSPLPVMLIRPRF